MAQRVLLAPGALEFCPDAKALSLRAFLPGGVFGGELARAPRRAAPCAGSPAVDAGAAGMVC